MYKHTEHNHFYCNWTTLPINCFGVLKEQYATFQRQDFEAFEYNQPAQCARQYVFFPKMAQFYFKMTQKNSGMD